MTRGAVRLPPQRLIRSRRLYSLIPLFTTQRQELEGIVVPTLFTKMRLYCNLWSHRRKSSSVLILRQWLGGRLASEFIFYISVRFCDDSFGDFVDFWGFQAFLQNFLINFCVRLEILTRKLKCFKVLKSKFVRFGKVSSLKQFPRFYSLKLFQNFTETLNLKLDIPLSSYSVYLKTFSSFLLKYSQLLKTNYHIKWKLKVSLSTHSFPENTLNGWHRS